MSTSSTDEHAPVLRVLHDTVWRRGLATATWLMTCRARSSTAVDSRVGAQLPAIAHCRSTTRCPALNTIRQPQRLLIDEGLLEARQGVGVFVVSHHAQPTATDMVAELKAARAALDRVIAAIERADDAN